MNAVINLNHFCEIHGPITIFSTQTVREKALITNSSNSSNSTNCYGCGIGNKTVYLSKENKDSSILYVSSGEKSIIGKDNQSSLITLRSLSCEITQEGLVYFGDTLNSLCFTFKVKDSMARGFEKLYSIVVVMKDKMFLLNTQTFLSNNIKDVAKQIQESAQKVYEIEQKQFPQRAERLNTGKASNVPPRSLKELTGESNIFAHLHSLFAWILWRGSRYYTEIITLGTPSVPSMSKDLEEGFAFIQIDKEDYLMNNFAFASSSGFPEGNYNLRALESVTSSYFKQILFYSLVGIQIVVRGELQKTRDFSRHFKDFLPSALHRFVVESNKYLPANKARILCLPSEAGIPSQNNFCRVDFVEGHSKPSLIRCPFELPARPPALMVKILQASSNELFSNQTLDKFIKALIEEWKNKAICLSHQNEEQTKSKELKKALGIQSHDDILINYWLSAL